MGKARLFFIAGLILFSVGILGGCTGQSELNPPVTSQAGTVDTSGDLLAALSAELERQLDATGWKSVSAPPTGNDAIAVLSFDSETSTLSWGYYSPGDYDQNGEVNVADITPIAVHFGESGGFTGNSIQAVVDGDSNGEINTADITPLVVNFGTTVSEYRIFTSTDETDYPWDGGDNGPTTVLLEAIPLNASVLEPGSRLQFIFDIAEPLVDAYYWVRPSDGILEGAPSQIIGGPNQRPIAQVTADPVEVQTPLKVTYDASASVDPDGTIVSYEWDFNSDGNIDYNSGAQAITEFYFYEPGNYTTTVYVTDNSGDTNSSQCSVAASGGAEWHFETVLETDPVVGPEYIFPHTALIDADNKPGIAFYLKDGDVNHGVVFMRADSALGTSWDPYTVIDPGVVDSHERLYLLNQGGKPTVFYDANSGVPMDFRTRQSTDDVGSAWSQPGAKHWEMKSNPVFVAGNPAFMGGDSKYYRAGDALGTTWTDGLGVIPAIYKGSYNLGVVDGRPAFSFIHMGDLMFVRANDELGESWPDMPAVVQYEGDDKFSTQLIDAGGHPAIAYRDDLLYSIYFVRALDAAGQEWGNPVLVDIWVEGNVLAGIHNERPMLLYRDKLTERIMFIAANDKNGMSWGWPQAVTSGPDDGISFPDNLATVDGNPAFCSYTPFNPSESAFGHLNYVSYY